MPSSWPSQISPIMHIVLAVSPSSILDIGAGYGKYGVLCREYLDIVRGARSARTYPPPPSMTMDCIEAYPEYISPIHRHVYDNVYVGDALDILPTLAPSTYDLALVVDVLEHFSGEDGAAFMRLVLRAARTALVATPTTDMPQGPTFGNRYETHRSKWTPRDLRALAPACRSFRSLASHTGHICLLSSDRVALAGFARRAWVLSWVAYRTGLLERLHLREPLRRIFRRSVHQLPAAAPRPGRDG